MGIARAMFGAILLTGWANAAEPADRLANAAYVPLPKPRKAMEQPSAQIDWCAGAITVLLNPHANELLRTATLEKARNRGCVN
jgi:hypothetical protein